MRLYSLYSAHGLLPEEGGIHDQAGVYVEAILFLDQEVNDLLKKEMDRMRSEA